MHTRKNKKNKAMIEHTLRYFNLDQYFSIEICELKETQSKFFLMRKLVNRYKKYEFDRVFIGDVGSMQIVLAANLNAQSIYHLDDGTETISDQKSKLFLPESYKYFSLKKKLRFIRYRLLGLDYYLDRPINLFTMFDLEKLPGQKIVRNEYSVVNNNFLKTKTYNDKVVYFIGQNIYRKEILDAEEYYFDMIKKVKNKLADKKLLYFPHRGEDIPTVKNKLSDMNIELYIPELPIELELLNFEQYPKNIISFTSTALVTISKIFFKANAYYIQIPNDIYKNQRLYINFNSKYDFFSTIKELKKWPS